MFACMDFPYFVISCGRHLHGAGWMILLLDCSSLFCFLLIEFYCTFSISYKIQQYYVYYYCIFLLGSDMPSGLLYFRTHFTSFHPRASLLSFFVCFSIVFHSCCSHARVFGKTLVHEFTISYNHSEWYTFFFRSVKAMHNWERRAV